MPEGFLAEKKRGFLEIKWPLVLHSFPSTARVSEQDVGHGSCYFLLVIPNATLGF